MMGVHQPGGDGPSRGARVPTRAPSATRRSPSRSTTASTGPRPRPPPPTPHISRAQPSSASGPPRRSEQRSTHVLTARPPDRGETRYARLLPAPARTGRRPRTGPGLPPWPSGPPRRSEQRSTHVLTERPPDRGEIRYARLLQAPARTARRVRPGPGLHRGPLEGSRPRRGRLATAPGLLGHRLAPGPPSARRPLHGPQPHRRRTESRPRPRRDHGLRQPRAVPRHAADHRPPAFLPIHRRRARPRPRRSHRRRQRRSTRPAHHDRRNHAHRDHQPRVPARPVDLRGPLPEPRPRPARRPRRRLPVSHRRVPDAQPSALTTQPPDLGARGQRRANRDRAINEEYASPTASSTPRSSRSWHRPTSPRRTSRSMPT